MAGREASNNNYIITGCSKALFDSHPAGIDDHGFKICGFLEGNGMHAPGKRQAPCGFLAGGQGHDRRLGALAAGAPLHAEPNDHDLARQALQRPGTASSGLTGAATVQGG